MHAQPEKPLLLSIVSRRAKVRVRPSPPRRQTRPNSQKHTSANVPARQCASLQTFRVCTREKEVCDEKKRSRVLQRVERAKIKYYVLQEQIDNNYVFKTRKHTLLVTNHENENQTSLFPRNKNRIQIYCHFNGQNKFQTLPTIRISCFRFFKNLEQTA